MDLIRKMDFLREIELFKDLKDEKLLVLARLTSEKSAKKHEAIYMAGHEAKELYILNKGTVKIGKLSIDGKEIIKSIIHSGTIFGESGMMGLGEHDNFAKAMDNNVKFYTINVEDFKQFLEVDSDLCWKVINGIGRKLKYAEQRLESLVFKDARERIIDFLKDNARHIGQKVGYETLIKHSLTQQDIANYTGTSRQTVTSVLNDLKKTNQIYFKRKSILIRDMASLS